MTIIRVTSGGPARACARPQARADGWYRGRVHSIMSYNPYTRYRIRGLPGVHSMGAPAGDYYDHQRQAPSQPAPHSEPGFRQRRYEGGTLRGPMGHDPQTTGHHVEQHQDRFRGRISPLPAPFNHAPPSHHSPGMGIEFDEAYDPYPEHPAYPSVLEGAGTRLSSSLGRVPDFDSILSPTMRQSPQDHQRAPRSGMRSHEHDDRLRLNAGATRARQHHEHVGMKTPAPIPRDRWPIEYSPRHRHDPTEIESLQRAHKAREEQLEQKLAALEMQMAIQKMAQEGRAAATAQAQRDSDSHSAMPSAMPQMPTMPTPRPAPEPPNGEGSQQGGQPEDDGVPALAELTSKCEIFTVERSASSR